MTDQFYKSIRELRSEAGENAQAAAGILMAYRDRARALNDTSNAFITIPDECEKAGAVETAMRGSRPLFGVPYSCKDVFRTRGIRTTAGSRVLRDFVPEDDAAVVTKLKRAGATLVGKTNLHEFCYGITGENPVFGTPVQIHMIPLGSPQAPAAAPW